MERRAVLAVTGVLCVVVLVLTRAEWRGLTLDRGVDASASGRTSALDDTRPDPMAPAPPLAPAARGDERESELRFAIRLRLAGEARGHHEVRVALRGDDGTTERVSSFTLAAGRENALRMESAGDYHVRVAPSAHTRFASGSVELTRERPDAVLALELEARTPIAVFLWSTDGRPFTEAWSPPRSVIANAITVEAVGDADGTRFLSPVERSNEEPGLYGTFAPLVAPGRVEVRVGEALLGSTPFDGREERVELTLNATECMFALSSLVVRVVEAGSGQPIAAGASFTVTESERFAKLLLPTSPNGEGRVSGLPPGDYWLHAQAPGYISHSEPIRIGGGETIVRESILLEPGLMLVGRFVDEEGVPVTARPLVARASDPLHAIGEHPDVPHEGGWFSVGALPKDELLLRVEKPGFAINPHRVYASSSTADQHEIELRRGTLVSVAMPRGHVDGTWTIVDVSSSTPLVVWKHAIRPNEDWPVRLLPGSYRLEPTRGRGVATAFEVGEQELRVVLGASE